MSDDEDGSSDEEWAEASEGGTPAKETPQEAPAAPAAPPPPAPPMPEQAVASPPAEGQSNNPFFRSMSQQATPSVMSPEATGEKKDTNPFHRLSNADVNKAQQALPDPAPAPTRTRGKPADEDDWSVVESSGDEDDEDEDKPQGGSAKQLASILFGTMGPPRPMSTTGQKDSTPSSPAPGSAGAAPPAPPPPPPPGGAPGAPPPPPPHPQGDGDASGGEEAVSSPTNAGEL